MWRSFFPRFSWNKILLGSSDWPWTNCVAQAVLKAVPPASWVLRLQGRGLRCSMVSGLTFRFLSIWVGFCVYCWYRGVKLGEWILGTQRLRADIFIDTKKASVWETEAVPSGLPKPPGERSPRWRKMGTPEVGTSATELWSTSKINCSGKMDQMWHA